MGILTTRKPNPNPKTQASKSAKSKQHSLPKQQFLHSYPPSTRNTATQFYYSPPPPPPPVTKHTSFHFSKPTIGTKVDIKKKPQQYSQTHQDPTMSNSLAPWVAINSYTIPLQVQPPQQVQQRQGCQPFPTEWAYVDQFSQARFHAERDHELDRCRQREDLLHGVIIDSFSRNSELHRIQNQNQNQKPDTTCPELKIELKDLRKEIEEQKRSREIKEALDLGRKEGAQLARKKREKQDTISRSQNGNWDIEREYGMFERARGGGGSGGAGRAIEQRMDDLEIFERGLVRGRQGLVEPVHVRRPVPVVFDPSLVYEGAEGFGYATVPVPVKRGYPGGFGGDDRLDTRLKDIKRSQQRIEHRFRLEDARREWEREQKQENILLRVNENVARFGRRFDGY